MAMLNVQFLCYGCRYSESDRSSKLKRGIDLGKEHLISQEHSENEAAASHSNLVLSNHIPSMMATQTFTIRDAWIVDSGCAQHVCNSASRFIQMDKYHGLPLRSVDASTTPSGVGTVNILCNARGRRKWLVLDNVLYVPSAHANLI
ncbi:hypothetical protein ASPFODRAFT_210455 [Aspergillus luchuensis CBS 106.47]|uniref:Retrovirus-related Pol polyprotein from transposon TNT 1-94-like beta-barrel domain-containing protein n=1 Tax=Aspergillus luchuensis (strain CBS 106.47) TaxID=1137211 RepID=A0A1M3T797_ASPLC|nr:hypothetical protein ASPFODRAFT_210455 [Aspergillus luchuensis CBS 106.47]